MVERFVFRGAGAVVSRAVSRGDFLRLGGLGVAGAALLPLAGCGGSGQAQEDSGGIPDPLTIGVIPAEDTEQVAATFEPIAKYVGEEVGVETKLYTATDYSGIIEAMRSGEAEVAWLGPLSYVLASQRANAEAIAVQLLEEGTKDPTYQSFIITRKDSGVRSLEDLKGKNFAFVDPASTSGNLFPRQAFKEAGMDPDEDLAEATFAGGHDASALAAANGDVDAGAVASTTFESMIAEGILNENDVRKIWESDPIPESPIAVRGDLSPEAKDKIKEAFVGMRPEDVGEEEISPDGAVGYVAARDSDYDVIRRLARSLNLDAETLAS